MMGLDQQKDPFVGSFSSSKITGINMQIYLARNNQQAGPYSLEQVNQMLANGQVVLTDLAWHEGMPEWKILGDLTQGKNFYQPALSAASLIAPWPTTAQVKSADPINELASVNQRILAKIIDLLLWFPASIIPMFFIDSATSEKINKINSSFGEITTHQTEVFALLPSAALWAVAIFAIVLLACQAFLIARTGQSVGKKVMKIRIVDDQTGKKTTLTRSFLLRSIVFIIAYNFFFPLFFVDLAFLFTDRYRTLHDRLAKTIVVKAKDEQLKI